MHKTTKILIILGSLIALLLAFGLGVVVGSSRAIFAFRFGQNYYSNFLGGSMRHFDTHGVAGEVIDVSTSTLSVKNIDGDETAVGILPDTFITANGSKISSTAIIVGNGVIIIGHPDEQGRIDARIIRVFQSTSSLPLPPGMGMMPAGSQLKIQMQSL